MTALGNTVLIAVVSAVISTILGTLGAIGVFYSKPKAKSVMEGLTQVPVINAEIVMAVSLVVLFLALHIDKGFFTLVIGHVVLTIAFVYLSVKPKLQQMDPNTYEAALDLGATPTRALFKVIIPEILPGIISGFMLALTLSLDDFLITAYTRSSSYETLSTFVQAAIKKSSIPVELRALTTLIFLVAVGIVLINNFRDTKQNKKYHSMRKGEK